MSKSLLEALQIKFPHNSRGSLQKWLKWGKVYLDGQCVRLATTQVSPTQNIEVLDKKPKRFSFEVLFEDRDLIVINKPAGVLSVASQDIREKNIHSLLKKDLKPIKVYPVHRLDREVCGPLVFAKSEKAYQKLKEAFYHKKPKREYLAIVEGNIDDKEGHWESFLVEYINYQVHVSTKEGKWAKTHYKVKGSNPKASLITLTLETGRKNQLRVHCAHAGHPILGDVKYGGSKMGAGSIALMAQKLCLQHPMTFENLKFEIKPSIDFRKLAKSLELDYYF